MIAGIAQGVGQSVFSQLQTAYSAKVSMAQYKYLAALARQQIKYNKAIAAKNISLTQDVGMRQSEQLYRVTSKLEGAQKAVSAGMGIGGGSVTTANLLEDTRIQSNIDQMAIRYGADMKSWQIQNDVNMKNWEEEVKIGQYNSAAKEVKKAAIWSGVMAIVTGGSGGGQIASGIGSLFSNSGTTQPTNVNNSMMNNPYNRAPAGYYQTGGTKVPQYLSVNS